MWSRRAVLALPQRGTAISSAWAWRHEAALCSREERAAGLSDPPIPPNDGPWLFRQRPPTLPRSPRLSPATQALEEVREELETATAVQDGHTVPLGANLTWARFQDLAFELRGHMSKMINLLKQPVPWAYFHILNLMVLMTLTLVAYGLVGMGHWSITLLLHAVISIVFIGMKNIAIAMADPFGDDPLDFNVEKFLGASYNSSSVIAVVAVLAAPCLATISSSGCI